MTADMLREYLQQQAASKLRSGHFDNCVSIWRFHWGLIKRLCVGCRSRGHTNAVLGISYMIGMQDSEEYRFIHAPQYFGGLMQDCSISSALALDILQSCNKPSI